MGEDSGNIDEGVGDGDEEQNKIYDDQEEENQGSFSRQ